jgi:bifunctional DNase/RNase
MVAVTIEGVRRSFWRHDFYVVNLWDEAGRRLLGIAIGQAEAYTLVMELNHMEAPRPTALHLLVNALRALEVVVEEVRIEGYKVSPIPFICAVVRLRQGDNVQELDARPSDALGLVAMLKCPLTASEELLEKIGVVLPEGQTPEQHYAEDLLKREGIALPEEKQLRLGFSKAPAREALVKEVRATLLGIPLPQVPSEVEAEKAKKEYLRFLLGDDYEQYYERKSE